MDQKCFDSRLERSARASSSCGEISISLRHQVCDSRIRPSWDVTMTYALTNAGSGCSAMSSACRNSRRAASNIPS